jgi:hypothetical protein
MIGLLTALVLLLMLGSSDSPAQPAAPAKPTPPKPKPSKPTPTTPVTPQVVPTVTPTAPNKPAAIPVSWPVAAPKGLPAFPSGWEADVPPPAAVSARAWALLPSLWKSGKAGATAVEQTAGRWITYQASVPSKGKRGVVAWRIKGNPPAGSLPSGNVQV